MKRCVRCGETFDGPAWHCSRCGWDPPVMQGHLAFAPEFASASEGFDAGFFELLARTEPGNFWFEARNDLIVFMLRRYFPGVTRFLEIGCGTGFVSSAIRRAMPDLAIAGSEIFSEGLAHARARLPDVTLFQMDARSIPFRGEFDVIGAFDVLEHIAADEAVLREMHEATRPGGGVIVTVPQHRFLWSATDEFSRHQRRYTRAELVQKLTAAGFELLRVTSFVGLLLPLMYLSRTRRDAGRHDPRRELAIHPALNAILGGVMRLELAGIKAGLTLPAGGSLLAVAKRA